MLVGAGVLLVVVLGDVVAGAADVLGLSLRALVAVVLPSVVGCERSTSGSALVSAPEGAANRSSAACP